MMKLKTNAIIIIIDSDTNKMRLQIKETLNIKDYSAYNYLNGNSGSYICKLW